MKKTIAILATLAVTLFSVNASAQAPEQDNQLFNHWSLGIGLLDDFHVQASGTVFPFMQVRIVYGTYAPYIGLANLFTKKNPNIGNINPYQTSINVNINQSGYQIDKMNVTAKLNTDELNFLLDFFPAKGSNFRLTAGMVLDLSPNLVTASFMATKADGTAAIPVEDRMSTQVFGITTDAQGAFNLKLAYGLKTVRPYIGIGFGRPVDLKKRVSVNFDLGVAFIGGLHLYAESYYKRPANSPELVELNEAWLNAPEQAQLKEQIGTEADAYMKYLNMVNRFPVMPYMRLGVNVRLF